MREVLYRLGVEGLDRLKGRRTFQYWRGLEQSQWLPAESLPARQLQALGALLRHAAANTPYHATTWQQLGLEAGALRTLEDFRRWPLVDRDTLRENAARMRDRRPGRADALIHKSTGGSTGAPVHFSLDHDSNERRMAATYRGYAWAGAGPGTRQLHLWGMALHQQSRRERVKGALFHGLHHRRMVDVFTFDTQRIHAFARELADYRPTAVVAYTSAACAAAEAFEQAGIRPYSPRAIVVGAEKLHGFQRTLLERVFGAPVFETYGSREFMLIAAECPEAHALHVTAEHLLVEILDDDGQPVAAGQEGQVVVTDLFNYGMPFIRYVTGDRAVAAAGSCPCGRSLPTIAKISGRQLDILTTPDGRKIPGEFFPHLMKDYPAVYRFQVVQESAADVRLRVVVRADWSDADRKQIAAAVDRVFGTEVRFHLERVPDIPLTPAGKLQVVINKTALPARSA